MRIDSSGNLGIGTTNPASYKLNVNGASNLGGEVNIISASALQWNGGDCAIVNSGLNLVFKTYKSPSLSERMRIDTDGRLGVNTSAPDTGSVQTILHAGSGTYALACKSSDTSGTIYHIRFLRDTSQAGYLTSTATTVSLNNASDARLKENIQNSNSAIQDLKKMQVRQFDWVDNIDTHRDFGFVAQELINVVPEAVTVGSEELDELGKPKQSWGIDYSHIIPRLVKVCQEQQAIIEQLEATNTSQQTKIDSLESRLTALES